MSNPIEQLERKVFQSFWDDGLMDSMLGFALSAIGFAWWQDAFIWGIFFPPLCATLWFPLRKRVVEPRIGYVEFSGTRELKGRGFRMNMIALLAGTMLLGVFLFLSGSIPDTDLPRTLVPGLPAFLLALMALPLAFFTGCRRFFIYALVLLAVSTSTIYLGLDPGLPILVGGAVILVNGLTILIRFLTAHPLDSGTSV